MSMGLDGFEALLNNTLNLLDQFFPLGSLVDPSKVCIKNEIVADGAQVLEYLLFDLVVQRFAFLPLKLNFVDTKEIVSQESYERVSKWKAILLEDNGLCKLMHFFLEEASHLVWFKEQLSCHYFDEEEACHKHALVPVILQLSLPIFVK